MLSTRTTESVLMDLFFSPQAHQDPYPHYAQLQFLSPVYKSPLGPILVSDYDNCAKVFRDPNLGKQKGNYSSSKPNNNSQKWTQALGLSAKSMLFADGKDHLRLRKPVVDFFSFAKVETLRPMIENAVDEILEDIEAQIQVDVMEKLAFGLPMFVIGELLGIPSSDRQWFKPLVADATFALEPSSFDEDLRKAKVAQDEMELYFRQLAKYKMDNFESDIFSALLKNCLKDPSITKLDGLDFEEVIATMLLLIGTGFETTSNLIGNTILALVQNPDQLLQLRQNPNLVKGAIDEVLRWDPPVQLNSRVALCETTIGEIKVHPGEVVVTFLAAANRDPKKFVEPHKFDITRQNSPIISFGGGPHHCLGSFLAKLEAEIVLSKVIKRFSNFYLCSSELSWRRGRTLRGLVSLLMGFEK